MSLNYPSRAATWIAAACLVVLTLAFSTGCSSVSRGSAETIRLAFHRSKVEPTAASVAALPYFQLQVNAPTGQAILILAKVEDGLLGWYGGQSDILFTRDGLLVRTVGLSENLDGIAVEGRDPFKEGLNKLHGPFEYHRRMDWSPGYRYGVDVRARLNPVGPETVRILGVDRQLMRVDEKLTVISSGEHMENRYWVDPADGFVWKSRQHVSPDFAVDLIQLRPFRKGRP